MEKYIGKCLDSLLIPEFDQVEVLVVNDGSKDRSSEIAHGYAERYPGSIRVIDKANGNYGSCINAALPLCTGRYVKILDADDTFDTEAFSEFVKALIGIDSDVVITEYVVHDENGRIRVHEPYDRTGLQFGKAESLKTAISRFGNTWIQMHQIAYKVSVLKSINYRQTEGISYTDTEWAIIPLYNCRNITFLDLVVYRYLTGRDGQTMAPERISNSISQLIMVFKRLVDFYVDHPEYNVLKSSLLLMVFYRLEFLSFALLKNWGPPVAKQFHEFDGYLRLNCPELYSRMNEIEYDPNMKFNFIRDIRNRNYPNEYKVPLWRRAVLSAKIHIKRFCRK